MTTDTAITGRIMRQTRSDEATRLVEIAGAPLIDRGSSYKRDRLIRPTRLVITWRRGVLVSVSLAGPAQKKDGTDSLREGSAYYSRAGGAWYNPPPAWLPALLDEFGAVPTWEETA